MRALVRCVLVLAVVTMAVACTTDRPVSAPSTSRPVPTLDPQFDGAPTLDPPNLTDDGPGSLVEVTPLKNQNYFDQVNATAVKITYRSTHGVDGPATQVSGVVAVPAGSPPRGGWPIISFGHAITGLSRACAPSLGDDVSGYAPIMSVLLSRGYVVALSDYEGLGLNGGQHSVIDNVTLGNNLVDAAKAAKRVVPSASSRWAALGFGEGAQAAWAANERASSYGDGLDLVGSVALSPLTDMSGLVDAAVAGTLSGDQYRLFAQVLASVAAENPDFDLDSYRSDVAREQWSELINCGADPVAMANTVGAMKPADLRPKDAAAAADLRQILAKHNLPGSAPLAAPLLVIYATDDPLIARGWLIPGLQRACGRGEQVEIRPQIGAKSIEGDPVLQSALDWLEARFDGQRNVNACQAAV